MSDARAPLVLVVMGGESDLEVVKAAAETLAKLGISHEVHIASAHRTPERAMALAKEARGRGVRAIIAAAGGAAHLAGVLAAHTTLPVIGVPISSSALKGLDALLATVQMPSGVPVATVAINGARNAAILAAEILAVDDGKLATKLEEMRADVAAQVSLSDQTVKDRGGQ